MRSRIKARVQYIGLYSVEVEIDGVDFWYKIGDHWNSDGENDGIENARNEGIARAKADIRKKREEEGEEFDEKYDECYD